MASFTEQATLLVVDKSSAKIKKINSELAKLLATANKLSHLSIRMNGLSKATTEVKKLNTELSHIGRRPINLRVNLQGTQQARSQLNSLTKPRGILAGLNVSGFGIGRSIARGFWAGIGGRLSGRLESVIGGAVARGGRAQDVAQFTFESLPLTPQERTVSTQAIDDLVKSQRTLNRAQTELLYAEIAPSFVTPQGGVNVAATRMAEEGLIKIIEQQTARGIPFDQARSYALDFTKAAVSAGRFQDAAGQMNPAKMKDFFDTISAGTTVIGEEFTGPNIRSLLANAPNLKQTLNTQGLEKLLLLGEEDRSRIAVAIETLRANLTPSPATMNVRQRKFNMATGFFNAQGVAPPEFQKAFGQDPFKAMTDFVVNNQDKIDKAAGRHINLQDRADVQWLGAAMFMNRNAQFAFTQALNQRAAMGGQLAFMEAARKQEINTTKSLVLAQARLQSSFDGLAGQMVRMAEPLLLPVMDAMTKVLSTTAEGKVPSAADLAALGVMPLGLKALLASGALTTVGVTAGIAGLASTNENTRLLGAIAVNTAATASNTSGGLFGDKAAGAAGILGWFRTAGIGISGILGISSIIANQRGTPAGTYQPGRSQIADWIMGLRQAAIASQTPEGQRQLQIAALERQLATQKANAERVASESGGPGGGRFFEQAMTQLAETRAKLDALTQKGVPVTEATSSVAEDRITRARVALNAKHTAEQQKGFEALGISRRKLQESAEKEFGGKEGIRQFQIKVGAFVDGLFGPQTLDIAKRHRLARIDELSTIKDQQAPAALAAPVATNVAHIAAAATEAMSRRQQMEQLTKPSEGFQQGMLMLDQGTTAIAAAFDIGTTKVATAGTSAGQSITTSVTGAGSAIAAAFNTGGASAAAQIRAALSTGVNVRMPTAPAVDTGAQTVVT
ncbi:hypothetical protein [Mesorhizobium kowhaii]|uniref:Uncharacterized protein n=1 Tax=Mesorhizobium kowhaii TaxID=1300272 RepID=A0A2W7C1R4_9HYPH|nr:hypothetical protein [Mesorhizobium kowhaii]PZV36887.1 hypothetical protein B5V02_19490 [Mesorhizobium kowhaii]